MKTLGIILGFFLSTLAWAGPVPGQAIVPSLTVGGRVFTDLTNLIVLNLRVGGVASHVTTARKPGGAAGYQVTSGKTLTLYAMRCISQNTSAAEGTLGYGDNDKGQDAGTTLPTNPVTWDGSSSNVSINTPGSSTLEVPLLFAVPSQKYVFMQEQDTGVNLCTLFGYEQ